MDFGESEDWNCPRFPKSGENLQYISALLHSHKEIFLFFLKKNKDKMLEKVFSIVFCSYLRKSESKTTLLKNLLFFFKIAQTK